MKKRLTQNQKKYYELLDSINSQIDYLRSLGYEIERYTNEKPKYITKKMLQTLESASDIETILNSYGIEVNVSIINTIKDAIFGLPDIKYFNGGDYILTQKDILISIIDDRLSLSNEKQLNEYIKYINSVASEIIESLDMIKFESKQNGISNSLSKVFKLLIGKEIKDKTLEEEINDMFSYYEDYFDDRYDDY